MYLYKRKDNYGGNIINEELKNLTPKQTVAELDKYIIGQNKAKRAVALRSRRGYRRPDRRHPRLAVLPQAAHGQARHEDEHRHDDGDDGPPRGEPGDPSA